MDINTLNPVRASYKLPESTAAKSRKDGRSEEAYQSQIGNGSVSKNELDRAVEYSNEIGQLLKRKLNFSVDESTEKVVVKVIDEESGEVVRQVPPTEMLRIAAHLKQLQEMNDKVMSAVKSVILDVRY